MKLKYIKAPPTKLSSVFVINFKYEHGDADTNTYFEKKVKLAEDQFIDYLNQVNICAQDIDDARAYGKELPDGFSEDQNCHGVDIPIEYDCHYQDAYASISIESIKYFNEDGVQFNVEME